MIVTAINRSTRVSACLNPEIVFTVESPCGAVIDIDLCSTSNMPRTTWNGLHAACLAPRQCETRVGTVTFTIEGGAIVLTTQHIKMTYPVGIWAGAFKNASAICADWNTRHHREAAAVYTASVPKHIEGHPSDNHQAALLMWNNIGDESFVKGCISSTQVFGRAPLVRNILREWAMPNNSVTYTLDWYYAQPITPQ